MQFYSYGSIVVVDAVTMLRKKVFRFEDLLEQKPEGSLDSLDMLPLNTPLENLAVIDEHSLFLADGQGMFRPDTETGVLAPAEAGSHSGNQGQTIDTVVATRGMTVIGDRLYCAGGGFWVETQRFEFTKRRDEVTCSLPLSGEFISGICRTGDHEIVVGTCGRTANGNLLVYDCSGDKPRPSPTGGGRRGFFVCRPAGVYSSTRLRGWIICSGLSTLSSSSWLISLCSSTSS